MVRWRSSGEVGTGQNLPCRDCCLSAGGAVSFIPEETDNETPSFHSRLRSGGGENRNSPAAMPPPGCSCLSFGGGGGGNCHQGKKMDGFRVFIVSGWHFESASVDSIIQHQSKCEPDTHTPAPAHTHNVLFFSHHAFFFSWFSCETTYCFSKYAFTTSFAKSSSSRWPWHTSALLFSSFADNVQREWNWTSRRTNE